MMDKEKQEDILKRVDYLERRVAILEDGLDEIFEKQREWNDYFIGVLNNKMDRPPLHL